MSSHAKDSSTRLLLIGWDAADWALLRPELDAGRMPALAGLIARGAAGTLAAHRPLDSTALFTTIATGRRPHEHGVLSGLEPDPDAQTGTRPMTRRPRRCRAIWQILHAQNLRCAVVNWPATHPAETACDLCVSDHFVVDIETGSSVFPPDLLAPISSLRLRSDEVTAQTLDQLLPDLSKSKDARRLEMARRLIATNATVHNIATWLLEQRRPDVLCICYKAIHQAWLARGQNAPAAFDLLPAAAARLLDMFLARLLQLAGDDCNIILASNHGYQIDGWSNDAADWKAMHRAQGLAVVAGPRVQAGELIGASVLDVTPTALALCDQPMGAKMSGRVWEEAFRPELRANIPDRRLGTYEEMMPDDPPRARSTSDDDASIAHLLALGYQEKPDLHARHAAALASRESRINLAASYLAARSPMQAVTLIEPLKDPSVAERSLLAEALFAAGEFDRCRVVIDKLLLGGVDTSLARTALAGLHLVAGQNEQALAALEDAARRRGSGAMDPTAAHLMGVVYLKMNRYADAEKQFRAAIEKTPEHGESWSGLAEALVHLQRADDALDAALTAIDLRPDSAAAHAQVAEALLGLDRPQEAVPALRSAIALAPTQPAHHRKLAAALTRLNDPAAAEHERAARRLELEKQFVNTFDASSFFR